MKMYEATVKDGDELLGHALGPITKEGDLAELVRQALDDFRRKNQTRPLLSDDNTPPVTIGVRAVD